MATEKKKTPSGVKSQSATEASQQRGQNARIAKLEKIVALLVNGNYGAAEAALLEDDS